MRVLRNEFVEEMSPRMWKRLSSYVSLLNALLRVSAAGSFLLFFFYQKKRVEAIPKKKKKERKRKIFSFFKNAHSLMSDYATRLAGRSFQPVT